MLEESGLVIVQLTDIESQRLKLTHYQLLEVSTALTQQLVMICLRLPEVNVNPRPADPYHWSALYLIQTLVNLLPGKTGAFLVVQTPALIESVAKVGIFKILF